MVVGDNTNHRKEVVTFPGIDNQSVELKITSYQFPNETVLGDYDANWLDVYLNVKSNDGHWQTVDPSLLTWDVERIVKWLSDLADNKTVQDESLEFIEHNLSFHLLDNRSEVKGIRISFDLESRPQSATDEKLYFVDCLLTNDLLRQLAQDLMTELSKFPKR